MGESQKKLSGPGFALAQSWLLQSPEERMEDVCSFLSLSLSNSDFQHELKKKKI